MLILHCIDEFDAKLLMIFMEIQTLTVMNNTNIDNEHGQERISAWLSSIRLIVLEK